jgi:hypothetical protein
MEKWVLMSVDISEGSNYKPSCMGVYDSEKQAREAAIFDLYHYSDIMKQTHDIDIAVYENSLTAYDEYNTYGIVLEYQKTII